eukprot:1305518-Prymnesium_polylepis.1
MAGDHRFGSRLPLGFTSTTVSALGCFCSRRPRPPPPCALTVNGELHRAAGRCKHGPYSYSVMEPCSSPAFHTIGTPIHTPRVDER